MPIPNIFERFESLRALIVGDVMLDAYVWGKVERISPEAPVPVVLAQRREIRLGGAGNVLKNMQALGAKAVLCSVIGADGYGNDLMKLLVENGLSTEGIIQSPNRITTVKERIIAGSQQIVRIDTETDKPLTESEQGLLLNKIKNLLDHTDVIIFEDYDKGVLDKQNITQIVSWANERGIPTVVDPKKRNFLHYHHVTLFKPNLKELKEGLNISFDAKKPAEVEQASTQIREYLQAKGTLITLSERGVYIDFNEEKHHIPAHIRQIADVSGAGDTVVSIAACALALGLPPAIIAALANLGGGLVCEQVGVVPIDKSLLETEAEGVVIQAQGQYKGNS